MAAVTKVRSGWEVRWRTPDGGSRRQRFSKKIDAVRKQTEVTHTQMVGSYVDPSQGRMTFGTFVAEYYRPTMVSLAPSTQARDESYLRSLILPRFERTPLATIDYSACQAWVNGLSTQKAPATVVKAAQIMGKVMKTAVRARRLVHNPMLEVILPSVVESEDQYLTPAQVETLADAMEVASRRYRALVWLGCYGGPRIGELAALRWCDLDTLRRTVTITRKSVEVHGHLIDGPTKTKAGRRTVTLPRRVVDELDAHAASFPPSGPESLVFTSEGGGPIRANNLRRRAWAEAVKSAGLVGFTFHDMRHTAVSLWVAAGASDLEVAKWAGHRSAAFTKSRYAHLFPEHGEALAARLDALIESSTSRPAGVVVPLHR